MKSEQEIQTAEELFYACFSSDEQAMAVQLKELIDILAKGGDLQSGSLKQIETIDNVLGAKDGIEEENSVSELPDALSGESARAVILYLKKRYDIIITDTDPADEFADATVELTDEVGDDEEGAFDPTGARAMAEHLRSGAVDQDQQPADSSRPDVMDQYWPKLRDSLEKVYDSIAQASVEKSSDDENQKAMLRMKIEAHWQDIDEREWFMSRMAKQRDGFGRLFTRGRRYSQARANNQDVSEFFE